ncbi:MAG: type II toxin-antitoxin system VapC family toxin [Candidatus Sericytochromatia bacterium]|nr:type II toxin-antitoxin system VapC family toxin [Candidatus Sericytochromatia bacterium]
MIVLDTCILIFDALTPDRLSPAALTALDTGEQARTLACADISLWEIAMLIAKGRLAVGMDGTAFIRDVLAARAVRVLPVTPEIASTSAMDPRFQHADPADRLIAATALVHHAALVTSDGRLLQLPGLATIW